MEIFSAAEKLLNGTMTQEEFQALPHPFYGDAILDLARLRVKKLLDRKHVWYLTPYGETHLTVFERDGDVHLGPKCAYCDYQQCLVCQTEQLGYDKYEVCNGKGNKNAGL